MTLVLNWAIRDLFYLKINLFFNFSQYYCLDKYETQFQEMHSEWQVTRLKKTEKYYEQSFKHLIVNYWKDINMIDQYRTGICAPNK